MRRAPRDVESRATFAAGPGRLCRALAIDRSFDGIDLFDRFARYGWPQPTERSRARAAQPRIGMTQAANRRLRFYEAGSPYVSGPARLSPA